ncbi:unnamed protein product, partial [Laminaria digitata]
TQHEGRLYTLRIHCGEEYPDRCPVVRFVSKLNMGCVDQRSGEVFRNKLQVLAQWNRNYGIEQASREGVLVALRNEMAGPSNRRLPQPPEGTEF